MTGSSRGMRTSFGEPEARPRKKKMKSILKFGKYCSRHESGGRLIWQKMIQTFLFFWGNAKETHSQSIAQRDPAVT